MQIPSSNSHLAADTLLKRASFEADLDLLSETMQRLYAPLELKEKAFHFKFSKRVARFRERLSAVTETRDAVGIILEFLTGFHDGHFMVSFLPNTAGKGYLEVPLSLELADKRVFVNRVDPALGGVIGRGDELIAVDGIKPAQIARVMKKYITLSDPRDAKLSAWLAAFALMRAEYFAKDGLWPAENSLVKLTLIDRTTGNTKQIVTAWKKKAGRADWRGLNLNNPEPIFASDALFSPNTDAILGFHMTRVEPDQDSLSRFGVADSAPGIWAALYPYRRKDGEIKRILLIRQPSYFPPDFKPQRYLAAYKALLSQYANDADVLVIDETHNSGGYYCPEFFRLFARAPAAGPLQAVRANPEWVERLEKWAGELQQSPRPEAPNYSQQLMAEANAVRYSMESGDFLSGYFPLVFVQRMQAGLSSSETLMPDNDFTWTKPFMVLQDAQSRSCAEMFSALVKASGAGILFGEQTPGLGGFLDELNNVELPATGMAIGLTQGLWKVTGSGGRRDLSVESHGVEPDYPYSVSPEDFTGKILYGNYLKAVSEAAATLSP